MAVGESQTSSKGNSFSTDLMLIAMSFVWGINFSMVKSALTDLDPLVFNAIRFGTASVLLLSLLWVREHDFGIRKEHINRFILLSLIGNTAYQLFFILGIARTTASNSSLIIATTPIFIVLLGAILGVEKITKSIVLCTIVSLIGVILIITGTGKTLTITDQTLIGDLLLIANPVLWGTYTVLSKPMLKEYSPLKLTALTVAIGAVPLVLVSIPFLNAQDWNTVSAQAWFGLAFSACFAIGIGYVIWYTGVSRVGSARTALYDNLVTVVAVAFAWIFLSESMTSIQIAGAILVFIGLYLTRKKKRDY